MFLCLHRNLVPFSSDCSFSTFILSHPPRFHTGHRGGRPRSQSIFSIACRVNIFQPCSLSLCPAPSFQPVRPAVCVPNSTDCPSRTLLCTAAHLYRLHGPPCSNVDLAVAPSCVGHDGARGCVGIVAVRWKLVPRPSDDDLWREGRAQRPLRARREDQSLT
jgi:hypothetical protein